MSHVTAVDCKLTNLDELEVAAARLGFVLMRDQLTHDWFGEWVNDWSSDQAAVSQGFDPKQFGKCQHALRLKDHRHGDYEIGLVARRDGKPGWELVFDSWGCAGRKLMAAAGPTLGKLKDEYAFEGARRELTKAGYKAIRRVNADGKLQVAAYK